MTQVDAAITPAMLVERARAMRPRLREQQEANDQRGYYSDEIHQAFLRNGFYRILQPKRFGGYEMDFVTFAKVIMEISQGHPASGWCYTLAASHALLVASHWSEAAQAEIFGPAGDFRSPHGSRARRHIRARGRRIYRQRRVELFLRRAGLHALHWCRRDSGAQ